MSPMLKRQNNRRDTVHYLCCFALVSMRTRIRIQFFTSMRIRIRIQGVKPMRIHTDLDPDPGQTLPSRKAEFFTWKIHFKQVINLKTCVHGYESLRNAENHVYLLILVNFLDPCFESGFTFPIWIRIRSQITADQCGSGSGSTLLPLP